MSHLKAKSESLRRMFGEEEAENAWDPTDYGRELNLVGEPVKHGLWIHAPGFVLLAHETTDSHAKPLHRIYTSVLAQLAVKLDVAGDAIRKALADRPSRSLQGFVEGKSVAFETPEAKFNALEKAWTEHNSGRSVVDYGHFSHIQIIGMGPVAIPLLLKRLLAEDGKWIYALKSISGEQADTPAMRGDLDAVIGAWREWGKRNGHI